MSAAAYPIANQYPAADASMPHMIFAADGQSIGTNAAASVTAPTMNATRSQNADDRLATDNSTVLMST